MYLRNIGVTKKQSHRNREQSARKTQIFCSQPQKYSYLVNYVIDTVALLSIAICKIDF